MSNGNEIDPQQKHWLLISVMVPIAVALIAILPSYCSNNANQDNSKATVPIDKPAVDEKIEYSTRAQSIDIDMKVVGDNATTVGVNKGTINITNKKDTEPDEVK